MAPKQVTLFVGALDQGIKEHLAADAAEREASINDVAVGILADRFKVKFVGTGRKGPGARGSLVGSFRMPRKLDLAIYTARSEDAPSKRAVVERALAEHYGIDVPAHKRRTAAASA